MDINPELQDRLLKLVDWVGETGKELESGVRSQAPELAREILALGMWEAAFFIGMLSVLSVGFVLLGKKLASYAAAGEAADAKQKVWEAGWSEVEYRTIEERSAFRAKNGDRPPGRTESQSACRIFSIFSWVAAAGVFCAGVFPSIHDLVRISVAPRVYLVEQASKWVGKGR